MTSPTTPRDAIGLIERLRRPLMDSEGYFVQPSKRDLEAAAALDALQARVKELEASNRAEWNRRREAESQRDVAKAAADTLRQQRDEAVSTTRYKIFDNLLGAYIGADNEQTRVAIGNFAYMIFPEYRDELRKAAEDRRLAAGTEKEGE